MIAKTRIEFPFKISAKRVTQITISRDLTENSFLPFLLTRLLGTRILYYAEGTVVL